MTPKPKKVQGVIAITHIPGMPNYLIPEAVAVVAEMTGIAKKAKDTLKIEWTAGPMDSMSDAQIDELLNGIIDKVASPGEGIETARAGLPDTSGGQPAPGRPACPVDGLISVTEVERRHVEGTECAA